MGDQWYDAVRDGKRARLRYATPSARGLTHAEGRVIAYCDAPQILIETDDGHRVWWRADLSKVVEEDQP